MKTKFLRESPPRYVDVFSQAALLFSGFLQQFGWFFFTFGMIFFWVFGMQSSLVNIARPMGETVETTGTLVSKTSTMSSENDVEIYRFVIRYYPRSGEQEAVCYGPDLAGKLEGAKVDVVYSKDHPERAYIPGMRRAVFSGWVIFVAIFPLIGLIFILVAMRNNLHYLRLLRVGRSTTGSMSRKDPTGSTVTINNTTYPVYKYVFQFEVNGQSYEATAKTHLTEKLEDEDREIILYDELNPSQNVLFDSVSGGPRIDQQGYLRPAPAWKLVLFILPALAILVNFIGYILTIG